MLSSPPKNFIQRPLQWRSDLTPMDSAVSVSDRTYTWEEIFHLCSELHNSFAEAYEERPIRIGYLGTTEFSPLCLTLALLDYGLSAVPLNPRLHKDSIYQQLLFMKARSFFVPAERLEEFADCPLPLEVFRTDKQGILTRHVSFRHSEEDEACVLYTSGSSGEPKGVIHPLRSLYYSAVQSNDVTGLDKQSRWLLGLPLCHAAGLMIVVRSLLAGSTIVLSEKSGLEAVVESLNNRKITHLSLIPEMLATLLKDHSTLIPALQGLTAIILGGAPPPKTLLERCRELSLPLFLSYGMTETASHVCLATPDTPLGSVGRSLPGSLLEVRHSDNDRIALGGLTLFSGYISSTGEIQPHQSEWFLTQDRGKLDADGFLYILGRVDDIIISGGEKICPQEIIEAALLHPEVQAATVTKLPDPKWGERPKLWIETGEPATFDRAELKRLLASRLSRISFPDQIEVLSQLPRTALGKIDKKGL